jgi:hypothetical protein
VKSYIHARLSREDRATLEKLKAATGRSESDLVRLGAFSLSEHRVAIEALLRKYADRPISLAGACLIRCAELHDEPRVFSFDADFRVYRWARNRKFETL